MGFTKQIGPVTISESGGEFKLTASISQSAGGGDVKGFVSGTANIELDLHGDLLMEAGLAALASKYPSIAAEIKVVSDYFEAEKAKI